ncbi:MAG: WD40 repeat domain-containing protein [Chloroflexi bacterium]|nr:WD40 repeat domain-containing protein [Chloroflexota bacterium]
MNAPHLDDCLVGKRSTLRAILMLFVVVGLSACIATSPVVGQSFTPESRSASLNPLTIAARIFPVSWSPDSQILAYWTFTAQEVKQDFMYPPGTLYFANAKTGQTCKSVLQIGYGYTSNPLAWLHDGRVLFISNDGQVKIGSPCDDNYDTITDLFPSRVHSIASHNSNHTVFLLNSENGFLRYEPQTKSVQKIDSQVRGAGISWSPSEEYFAVTAAGHSPDFIAHTFAVAKSTGDVLEIVTWKHFDAEGSFGGPIWLNENQFLIQQTIDRGPLLVTIGKGAIGIAPRLFGLAPKRNMKAAAARIQDSSPYHIALSTPNEDGESRTLLYHSENAQVEYLPFPDVQSWSFSPNGKAFVAVDSRLAPYRLWSRTIDPIDSALKPLPTEKLDPFPVSWSPKGDSLAVRTSDGLAIFSVPDGARVGSWDTDIPAVFPALWSPNVEFLAWQSEDGKLFVVHVPKR